MGTLLKINGRVFEINNRENGIMKGWGKRKRVKPKPEPEPEQYEYVDLGLPSGTLWAADLVEEDDGEGNKVYHDRCIKDADGNELYFAWGETQGYTYNQILNRVRKFDNENYKFSTYDVDSFTYIYTKYNETDGKTVLDPEDDAATVNLGPEWKIPKSEDFAELIQETDFRIDNDNIPIFTKNGKTLVFPMYGYVNIDYVTDINDTGSHIWTYDLDTSTESNIGNVYSLRIDVGEQSHPFIDNLQRYLGSIVVPVKKNN